MWGTAALGKGRSCREVGVRVEQETADLNRMVREDPTGPVILE